MVEEQVDVVVVGAGLAGLAAGATAAAAGASTVVVDAHRPGGRAVVDQRGGFSFNRGPRALYIGGAAAGILDRLGVATRTGGTPAISGIMLRRDGVLHRQPVGPASLLRTTLLTPREKLRAARLLSGLTRLPAAALVGRTVTDWLAELDDGHIGELVATLVRITTYTNAPDTFDAGAAAAAVSMGVDPGVRYLDGGFQSLVGGLVVALADRGGRVLPHAPVSAVDEGDGGARLRVTAGDRSFVARTVVVATGGPDSVASVLGLRPASWGELGPPATVACLELGVSRLPRHGGVFGVDEPLYLNTHCPPATLAPPGQGVVHAMRYQPPDDAVPAADQQQQLRDLARDAGIADADIVEERFLARMEVTGAIPTAAGGGLAGRPTIEVPERPGVLVAGDWVGPVGLLADASVASGAASGQRAADRAARLAA